MKPILTLVFVLFASLSVSGQELYLKTFGNIKDRPVIFLHGGPGYNSAIFEATTAQKLSKKGIFVILYDRRGEGRSHECIARYTFKETCDDLNSIYQKFGLKKATLIGHSFGGVVATSFAVKYPEKIVSIVLAGAPVSFQETFRTILSRSKALYQKKNDLVNLNYISVLEKMDKSSIDFSSLCFMHAMQNGFYSPQVPTEEAKAIYSTFNSDPLLKNYASHMTPQGPQGFWKNERYTTIDLKASLQKLLQAGVKIYGLYGMDDGLYSVSQVNELQELLGYEQVRYIDQCSHHVYVDQQSIFIDALNTWSK